MEQEEPEWYLEIALSCALIIPWCFSGLALGFIGIAWVIAILFYFLLMWMFSRSSVIESFLLTLLPSILIVRLLFQ